MSSVNATLFTLQLRPYIQRPTHSNHINHLETMLITPLSHVDRYENRCNNYRHCEKAGILYPMQLPQDFLLLNGSIMT